MAKSRKAGTAGRFGARYGRVARKNVAELEAEARGVHVCPSCGADSVKREASGVWRCRKCEHKFAGGAYRPETSTARTVENALRKAKESAKEDEPDGV